MEQVLCWNPHFNRHSRKRSCYFLQQSESSKPADFSTQGFIWHLLMPSWQQIKINWTVWRWNKRNTVIFPFSIPEGSEYKDNSELQNLCCPKRRTCKHWCSRWNQQAEDHFPAGSEQKLPVFIKWSSSQAWLQYSSYLMGKETQELMQSRRKSN